MTTFELILLLAVFVWTALLQLQNRARRVEINTLHDYMVILHRELHDMQRDLSDNKEIQELDFHQRQVQQLSTFQEYMEKVTEAIGKLRIIADKFDEVNKNQ